MIKRMKVLIIIPAYNEQNSLLETVKGLKETIKKDKDSTKIDYVIINDCSNDKTLDICRENNLNIINLPVNLGIGGAVQTGYKYALENDYDIAIQMDADGQHKPEYIYDLIKAIVDGNDMVIASRFIEKNGFQSTFLRRLGINLYSKLIKLFSGVTIKDTTSGYRAVNKRIIKYFAKSYPVDYPEPETNAILAKAKCKISEIPVIMEERKNGKSSITALKSIYYAGKVALAIIISSIIKGDIDG